MVMGVGKAGKQRCGSASRVVFRASSVPCSSVLRDPCYRCTRTYTQFSPDGTAEPSADFLHSPCDSPLLPELHSGNFLQEGWQRVEFVGLCGYDRTKIQPWITQSEHGLEEDGAHLQMCKP